MWLRVVSLILFTSALGGAGLAEPVPAAAPTAAAPAANPAPTAPAAKPRLICQDQEETGSHFSHRVCLTKSQWDSLDDNGNQPNFTVQHPIGSAGFGASRAGGR